MESRTWARMCPRVAMQLRSTAVTITSALVEGGTKSLTCIGRRRRRVEERALGGVVVHCHTPARASAMTPGTPGQPAVYPHNAINARVRKTHVPARAHGRAPRMSAWSRTTHERGPMARARRGAARARRGPMARARRGAARAPLHRVHPREQAAVRLRTSCMTTPPAPSPLPRTRRPPPPSPAASSTW